jgi:RHS repeat-associated protein
LDYAQARYYSADWGRFMSPDPMGLGAAGKNSPKSLNRYSYVSSDPINFRDPGGTCFYYWYQVSETYGYWDSMFCYDENWLEQPELPPATPEPVAPIPCDAQFLGDENNFPRAVTMKNGLTVTRDDLNVAARVIFAEAQSNNRGGNYNEKLAVASVLYNRLGNRAWGGKYDFTSLVNSGQFEAVTGSDTRKYDRSHPDKASNLGALECNDIKEAINAIWKVAVDGPVYPQFQSFRGGLEPLREGMTIIGGSRFAASDAVFNPPSGRR